MTTATSELEALLTEHDAQMVEMDETKGFLFWSARVHGRITLVFPTGQDPAVRLQYAHEQIQRLEQTAVAA
jgi:hypothetical protein